MGNNSPLTPPLQKSTSSPSSQGELRLLRPWSVVLGLCIIYLAFLYLHYYGPHFQTQSPLRVGKPVNLGVITIRYNGGPFEFVWPTSAGQPGYDGQFTYYVA